MFYVKEIFFFKTVCIALPYPSEVLPIATVFLAYLFVLLGVALYYCVDGVLPSTVVVLGVA